MRLVTGDSHFHRLHQGRLNQLWLLLSRDISVHQGRRRRQRAVHRQPTRRPRRHVLVAGFCRRSGLPPEPDVSERLRRSHPLRRLPDQTALDEIHEDRLIPTDLERGRQSAGRRRSTVLPASRAPADDLFVTIWSFRHRAVAWDSLRTDEVTCPLARGEESGRRHAAELDDTGKLIRLIFAGKQRAASGQFGKDTAEAPHVDRKAVARAEDHLRSAVETRLDVGVDTLVLVTARPKVDHLPNIIHIPLE